MHVSDLPEGAIVTSKGPLVLLFYDGFERQLRRGFAGQTYSQGRRLARYLYRSARRKQVRTGFYTAFLALEKSLRSIGCDVRVNSFRLAERHPSYPIGVAGYPSVLKGIPKANPVIFGPGDFGLPDECGSIAAQDRFKILIQPSEWFCDVYRPFCGDKMLAWYAGIDTQEWPDSSQAAKTTDFLVYDKIRWNRDEVERTVLNPLLDALKRRGRSYEIVRYGHHKQSDFAAAVRRSRSMIFVCEHETQGLAYQEALATNVPVLAWDEGKLIDPYLAPFQKPGIAVSSVPYFGPECGLTFRQDNLEAQLDSFWAALPTYQPRHYVERELSMQSSAKAYCEAYFSLIKS